MADHEVERRWSLGKVAIAVAALCSMTPAASAQPEEDPEVPGSAGYDPDSGFLLRSEDMSWQLRLGLQAAYRFSPIRRDGETASGRIGPASSSSAPSSADTP